MSAAPNSILVADDDLTARVLMRAALEKSGFAVVLAEDGDAAVERFTEAACELVLLDVEMPARNGYQVCAELRRRAGAELPIVMVTGMDDLVSVDRAFEAGATDFIAKPINWGLIGHRLRYLLRSRQILQALHAANAGNAAILAAVPDTLLRLDRAGRAFDVHGGDLAAAGSPIGALPEAIHAQLVGAADAARRLRQPQSLEFRIGDGAAERHYEVRLTRIDDDQTLCLMRDVSERRRQELEVLATRNRLQATLDALPDVMFDVDPDGRFVAFHRPRDRQPVIPPESLMGKTIAEALPPETAAICRTIFAAAVANGRASGQFPLPLPGMTHWFDVSIARKPAVAGEPERYLALTRDITARKQAELRIERLANFDTLTGLPNRQSFVERLEREIRRARHADAKLAVMVMDVDRFKDINDTLGHAVGDLLLQAVAERLRLALRPADLLARSDRDATGVDLARLGGDEFTLLVPQLRRGELALPVAERIRAAIRDPFVLAGREVVVTASVGIAVWPDDGTDAGDLIKNADSAMYHAKDQGRDNHRFYNATLTVEAMRRLELESSLRLALERDEFFLVYQPQLDLASGRIRSLEALLRWRHPQRGIVPPGEFIPLAEESGLIVQIGEWVLAAACAEAARWHAAGLPLRVAVNLSANDFHRADLADQVAAVLARTGLPAASLELELTEGSLMADGEGTLATLTALRRLGVQLALDDFGTGYSSLSYLKRLPLNNLKIDQGFVRGLPDDRESLAIVRAIVGLARHLGFPVTAEGVETAEQARLLRELECETLQGYFIARPISVAEVTALLTPVVPAPRTAPAAPAAMELNP